jgi:hypothetical protein
MYYDPAGAVVTFRGHNLTERTNMTDQKASSPKPTQEWGFTAKPDFARICREVAATGADVARVSMRGSNPITLVRRDSAADAARARKRLFASNVTAVTGWVVLAGDHVAAVLEPKPEPVRVEAFGGRTAIDLETATRTPGAVAPPPVAPVTVKVRKGSGAGAGSIVEYIWGDQLRKPEPGWNAFLDVDGKVHGSSDFGRRRAVGTIVSGETWGLFDMFGRRSSRFPNTFGSKAGAETFIQVFHGHQSLYPRLITDPVAQRPMGTIRTVDPSAPTERWGIFGGVPSMGTAYRSSDYPLTYPTKAAAEAQIQRIPEPQCTTCRYRAERLP